MTRREARHSLVPTRSGRSLGGLAPFLRTARRYPPLSRTEEHTLALRARKGDVTAKHELVNHNIAFVVALARKQCRGSVLLDDIVQEGCLGLMRAADKFDPDAGTRFLTYATWWIQAFIGRFMKRSRSAVRPMHDTVARVDRSLDAPLADEDDVTPLERIVDEAPGPEDACIAAHHDQKVRDALDEMRPLVGGIGWDVVRDRLEQDDPKALEELGRRWKVSREHVRQIEMRTKELLRRNLELFDDDFLDAA